ncbi:UNVERIFIED_CONTAM: hypothetical protein GTU68_035712 [Idotea baltica]|nr:hypothetical protein [Idotea baltica]
MAILITGANGQIGTALAKSLRQLHGRDAVVASDIRSPQNQAGTFLMLDILNVQRLREIIVDYQVTEIYHLAAILSANGEWNPLKTWNVNLNGLLSILDLARKYSLEKVFYPSTIAGHGATTPKINTPQATPLVLSTVYGMSKLAGENWCQYYHSRYNLDVRSIRYPGVIGYDSQAGGGTTDYAVEIFHGALNRGAYTCFLRPDTKLPMLYIPDAVRATIELMHAPPSMIHTRYSYNLAGMSFTLTQLSEEIRKHFPGFKIDYQPDFRQEIADSWAESIDDQQARNDWGWKPDFDLAAMTADMIAHLKPQ